MPTLVCTHFMLVQMAVIILLECILGKMDKLAWVIRASLPE